MTYSNTDSFDLKSYLILRKKEIDHALGEILKQTPKSRKITQAMEYSLLADGKRIRPILCLAATEAVRGETENVLPAACAIEMIHTYSLIHDDLPAMDNDDRRRGKPTCHIAFDEATAVLAGDALLTLAFQILSSKRFVTDRHASKWLQVCHAYAMAAGHKGMIEGQMRDIASEGAQMSVAELENLHSLKTGALIDAAIYAGALLGNGTDAQIEALHGFARHIGLAFQVCDDILDVEGDPAVMGKSAGSDAQRQKCTYPALLGLAQSKVLAHNLVNSALQALHNFDNRSDPLRAIARYIVERKK